ncbi:unnamed protein product [Protopolystoma xenopodis]|uniref:Uncharacterized protein n=1 Tax=Protopolystoma xenopodis TaxID=117903 RepID=A0A448WZL3_9PLAT|nr:unnamed protein product [Protopolystoma xenopodis]
MATPPFHETAATRRPDSGPSLCYSTMTLAGTHFGQLSSTLSLETASDATLTGEGIMSVTYTALGTAGLQTTPPQPRRRLPSLPVLRRDWSSAMIQRHETIHFATGQLTGNPLAASEPSNIDLLTLIKRDFYWDDPTSRVLKNISINIKKVGKLSINFPQQSHKLSNE